MRQPLPIPGPAGRPGWPPLACVLLLSLSACGGEREPDTGVDPVELSADAIEVLGTSEDLTLVRDLEVDADGTVWVLDDAPPFFVGFDRAGGVVAGLGRRGQGPREFGDPVRLLRLEGGDASTDGIWVFDRRRDTLLRLTAPGAEAEEVHGAQAVPFSAGEVSSLALFSDQGGMPGNRTWVTNAGGSALAAHAPGAAPRGPAYWRARIVELDLADGSLRERWDMREFLEEPEGLHPGATEFMPVPLWASCPDGTAWLYDPASNEVRSLPVEADAGSASPRSPAVIGLTPERRVGLTASRMVEVLYPFFIDEVPASERPPEDQIRGIIEAEIADMVGEAFASVFPEYYQMQCATDSTLWLQWFEWEDGVAGQGWRWTRLRPGERAAPLQVVRFPTGFDAMRFEGDRVWGIVRDDLAIPSVAYVTLP